jgi:hypothetical protein
MRDEICDFKVVCVCTVGVPKESILLRLVLVCIKTCEEAHFVYANGVSLLRLLDVTCTIQHFPASRTQSVP